MVKKYHKKAEQSNICIFFDTIIYQKCIFFDTNFHKFAYFLTFKLAQICTGNLKVDTHYFIVRHVSQNCYASQ